MLLGTSQYRVSGVMIEGAKGGGINLNLILDGYEPMKLHRGNIFGRGGVKSGLNPLNTSLCNKELNNKVSQGESLEEKNKDKEKTKRRKRPLSIIGVPLHIYTFKDPDSSFISFPKKSFFPAEIKSQTVKVVTPPKKRKNIQIQPPEITRLIAPETTPFPEGSYSPEKCKRQMKSATECSRKV